MLRRLPHLLRSRRGGGSAFAASSAFAAHLYSTSSSAADAMQKGSGASRILPALSSSGALCAFVSSYGLDKDTAGPTGSLPLPRSPTNAAFSGLDAHREMGEDAVMVSSGTGGVAALAVCDGVGGWRAAGVDPGIVSHSLAAELREGAARGEGAGDPSALLHAAYTRMVSAAERDGVVGSTTACVATLVPSPSSPDEALVRTVNVGDSCLVLVRDGKAAYVTPETVHGTSWNPPPFQLAALTDEHRARGCCSDTAADGARGEHPLRAGDTVVLGSDGLLDNVPAEHVAGMVGLVHARLGAAVPPEERSQHVARALLAAAVLSERKVDDVSVVVAYIGEVGEARL